MTPKRSPVVSEKRTAMYCRDVADRAGIFYRLGYTAEQAGARLRRNAAWDFGSGATRPKELNDAAIDQIVAATYARRPAR